MKKLLTGLLTLGFMATFVGAASAHVVVKPGDVLTGAYQTFTVSVPNEKEVPVTQIKLLIPASIKSATPTVKPGWTITTEKTGSGETAVVTSITWSAGSIGAGLRDDFTFSAKTPDTATDLQWKAYQTYADGVTVAWDQPAPKPGAKEVESETSGPFSVTKVAAKPSATTATTESSDNNDPTARALAAAGLAVAVVSFALVTRKK